MIDPEKKYAIYPHDGKVVAIFSFEDTERISGKKNSYYILNSKLLYAKETIGVDFANKVIKSWAFAGWQFMTKKQLVIELLESKLKTK